MDPESGAVQVGQRPSQEGEHVGVMQQMIQALLSKLRTLLDSLGSKQTVGVENRFYYDETEKVWKLRGGETEAERAESEAFRFHTGRGLSSSLAPATTACDATRGDWHGGGLPPPPPAKGPVSSSLHGTSDTQSMPTLAHPVYAPQGLGQLAPPPVAPAVRETAPAAPLASPFGQVPIAKPLASPFGTTPGQRPVIASPFAPQS
mmetsp:Transcript_39095/g.72852  ORF Transcript_39095/g.72852 Transcript_39095/m.72852 type:complete len:204 (-) Transcript_39095:133-744(-)